MATGKSGFGRLLAQQYDKVLLLVAGLGYISRDPLGLGIVFSGHLTAIYCVGTVISLLLRPFGGGVLRVWNLLWLDGMTPWLLTGLIFWLGRRRAVHLRTTKYHLATRKKLPGGKLRVVQVSDIHPRACAAMDHTRIPELKAKIEACQPDMLVLTGDIFDEFTEPEELKAAFESGKITRADLETSVRRIIELTMKVAE